MEMDHRHGGGSLALCHRVWRPRIYHKFEVPVTCSTTIPESLL
jgi:hypothetical protein